MMDLRQIYAMPTMIVAATVEAVPMMKFLLSGVRESHQARKPVIS